MRKDRSITVTEFDRICEGDVFGRIMITADDIKNLRDFIDLNSTTNASDDIQLMMKPIRRGIQVSNYVGVIRTKSGLTIEILPKFSKVYDDMISVKKLFIKMLKTVKNINGKSLEMTNLDTDQTNIFELYVSMFINEARSIVKKGMMSAYRNTESNEYYLKGKLNIKNQIQLNSVNQARFYNAYDDYKRNILENQMIKATLLFLKKESQDFNNRKSIIELLNYFEDIDSLKVQEATFKSIKLNRHYHYYEQALKWAEIFLLNKSFSSFHGQSLSYAYLFPMEKVFESYVATMLKKSLIDAKVTTQENTYALLQDNQQSSVYRLKPDIVIQKNNNDKEMIIIDTKWKLLDHKGPSQSDIYQMYAYYTRYKHHNENVKKVILLYPKVSTYEENSYQSLNIVQEIKALIEVRFVDLMDEKWCEKFIEKNI